MSFSEWREVKVSEIGKIVTGKTPKTAISENYGGNIPFLTPSDDMNIKKVKSTARTLSEMGLNSVKNCLLPAKSICVSCIGSDLGKVVLTSEPTVTNQQINSIVPDEKFDPDFIYYGMTILGKHLNYLSKTSTAVPIINKTTFSNFSIIVPSIEEQKAIAHILSTLDDKIEVNNQINKTLENMAQAIFKHWFVDFEFPNEDGEPYKSSGGEMIESELGMIPKGWEIVELCNIVLENRRGFAPSYNKNDIGIPVINQRCIRNHTIIEEAVKYHDNEVKKASEDVYHKPFDVLINSMGVGTLGRVSQVSKVEEERIVHSCITILRANKDIIEPIILGHMIKNLEAVIEMMGTGSTGQTSLNNKNLGMLKVVLPPISIQNEISVLLTKFLNKIDQNNIESNKLVQIRDSLLPKLMSGEIRVPMDEEGDVS